MKGATYLRRWGFSINEGAGPVNVHLRWWPCAFCWFSFWLSLWGLQVSVIWRRSLGMAPVVSSIMDEGSVSS